jgi:hypothetical protein
MSTRRNRKDFQEITQSVWRTTFHEAEITISNLPPSFLSPSADMSKKKKKNVRAYLIDKCCGCQHFY